MSLIIRFITSEYTGFSRTRFQLLKCRYNRTRPLFLFSFVRRVQVILPRFIQTSFRPDVTFLKYSILLKILRFFFFLFTLYVYNYIITSYCLSCHKLSSNMFNCRTLSTIFSLVPNNLCLCLANLKVSCNMQDNSAYFFSSYRC